MNLFDYVFYTANNIRQMKKNQKKCKLNRKLRRIAKNQTVKTHELKKLKMNNDIVDKKVSDQNDNDQFEFFNVRIFFDAVNVTRKK